MNFKLSLQLLTDPAFLFCDEATTSLDSYSAAVVIETLQQFANAQLKMREKIKDEVPAGCKTVICSIHQPSSEVFALFSHVLLMNEGSVVFQGTTKEASDFFQRLVEMRASLEFDILSLNFNRLGYIMPKNCNPADFYLKTIAEGEAKGGQAQFIQEHYEALILNRYKGSWLLPKANHPLQGKALKESDSL